MVLLHDRVPFAFLGRGSLEVRCGGLVVVREEGEVALPVGKVAVLFLEPGTRCTHEAVKLAATCGTLLCWVGEGGVRLYSSGNPGGARTDRLLQQAVIVADPARRLQAAHHMMRLRFGLDFPQYATIEALRGAEGARVRQTYSQLAAQHQVVWSGRRPGPWGQIDLPNRCVNTATSCLYGVTEAAIVASGCATGLGIIHGASQLAFVYDLADLLKMETVVPVAFEVVATLTRAEQADADGSLLSARVRRRCRDLFRERRLIEAIFDHLRVVLSC